MTLAKNPVMFVVEAGAALTTVLLLRELATGEAGIGLSDADRALAVVHGAVRELRGSDGGSARQSAGRQLAQNQDRYHGASVLTSNGGD